MGHLIQKLFFALRGFTRWLYYMLLNMMFSKNFEKNIGYYMFENEKVDNTGMDSNKKNFIIGIFIFILILFLIQYYE
ncbi:hypothetical protein OX283_010590 [Flavobacterium sp. SUN052]|nr:hypothetical protein [Flavobacterium sp. SUN052]